MWQRFTERARQVVFYAQEEAGKWGENYVSPHHLLLGITRIPENAGLLILERLGVSPDSVRAEVEVYLRQSEGKPGQDMQLTPRAKRVIDLAYDEARGLKHSYIGAEHILLGLLREGEDLAARVLTDLGITLDDTRTQLQQMQDKGIMPEEAPSSAGKIHDIGAYMKAAFTVSADKPSEELLSLDEAVKFLGTSKPTLYRLLGQDEIKGLKVGRQWRFRRADLIAYMERSPVAFSAAPKEDLDMELAWFNEHLGLETDETEDRADPETKTRTLARRILRLAIQSRASDIHIEPTPENVLLRLRVDGVLQETRRLPLSMKESLTAQFKTLAEMSLSETRMPQDGRIPFKHDGRDFDIRAAALPSLNGEALTLRILDRSTVLIGLDKLGLAPENLRQLRDLVQQPNGIVLATGPAGSGKTTLLYSCLQEIAGVEKKTMTIEDPVEYQMPYLTQTQVNKKAGLTFAAGLRSFLRQDPDIILVSEMRDLETAQIAVEAALTGHLVLSSLHTGDAASALLRLLDMGIEPYLISATVTGVVAARLARRVCESCKLAVDLSGEPTLGYVTQLAREGGYEVPADAAFVRGAGCDQCRGKGYRGRLGLYEVLTLTEPLAEALLRRATGEELTAHAVAGGMRTLLADGIRKAVEGQTTVEEVLRVVSVSV